MGLTWLSTGLRRFQRDSMTTIDDFHKLDIRVGKIVHVDEFPEARMPAFKLSIDFGELQLRGVGSWCRF